MARAAFRQIVLGLAATTLLWGCVDGGGPFAAKSKSGDPALADAAPVGKSNRSGNRDVEAPEVFQITDTALWDGRPSLGGVWVASPETKDPERVVMRNPANGKTVVGALFRRERDNPGPTLQISSDAAEALGLLAGQPGEISVTALRREEPAVEPAPEVVTAEAGAVAGEDAAATEKSTEKAPKSSAVSTETAIAAAPLDATAIATAALDEVDATGAAALPPVLPADAPQAEPAPPVKEKRKTRRQKRLEAAAAAKAAAAAEAGVEAAELPAPGAAESAAAADPVPVPAPAPTAGARPIQVGFFSLEANADRAVGALAKAGVTTTSRREENNGKAYWSVTTRGDAATLKAIKGAGFADAYFLK